MKTFRPVGTSLLALALLACAATPGWAQESATKAAPQETAKARDGQHDFDFNIGNWKTHIRRLQQPLSGSTTWVELDGTVVVNKVWGGRAQIEEIEADGVGGHFEGLTLFLYDPQSHQWNQSFAASGNGTLSQPAIGEFKNGRGELFDQESFNGKTILVRIVWSDITADSHRFEQSFSADGGKTWEANFVAVKTRATRVNEKGDKAD